MPQVPKSPPTRRPGPPKTKGAVRAKSGCYTCRIRRKKCDEQMNDEGSCGTCVRLRLQCLGFGAKRPEWLRENRNVRDLREKIKTFLASQGMIKGHSGSAPRALEHEPHVLALSADYASASNSPQTPTLSIPSTNDERPSSYPLRPGSYPDNDRLPVMHEMSPDSPLEPHEFVLPPVPYSSTPVNTSLDSWPNSNPLSFALQRPHVSDFSKWHSASIHEDEELNDVSSAYLMTHTPAFDQYSWPLLDDRQNAALDYYMKHVLHRQYVHASVNLGNIIWTLIHTNDNARQAVCLLSDLHRRSTQKDRLGVIGPEDAEALKRIQLVPGKIPLTEGDALAGLCIVSYFLFSGGKGQWQSFLDAACAYSLSILNDPRWGGPRRVLLSCSESLRFIIKTSIWFDVLASATLVREPCFLEVIRELFTPQSVFFNDELILPIAKYSMMPIMGCENHILLALAEIASLAHWKDTNIRNGSLSVNELVKRGHRIEEILKRPTWYLNEFDTDAEEGSRAQQRLLTSEVFRASAHVYLHSVISGDYPRCPEIIEAVNDTVTCLKKAEGPTGRAVVRSVVFSICICGCLTDDPQHQQYFLKRLREQEGLSIGNSQQVSHLIQEVWQRKRRFEAVDWRQVMREAEMLLV